MLDIWLLSQYYVDDRGWTYPVAFDYGEHYFAPLHPETPDGWSLVRLAADSHQLDAAKQDPRVVYCGRDYDTPPAKMLEVYASQLDPNVTYMFLGQVLARLAQTEPSYYHEF